MLVTVVLGTRPEAVKLAPVVLALRADPRFLPHVVHTGQHRVIAADVLDTFGIAADVTLDLLRPGQGLPELLGRGVMAMGAELAATRPDVVVVQGDTTTAAASALAAAQLAIPVVHVEAGLRSGDRRAPFPEEDNRRLIAAVADLHLAPTEAARRNLLAEGTDPSAIIVTGNTGIDALDAVVQMPMPSDDPVLSRVRAHAGPVALVTAHRRESWGADLATIATSLRRIVDRETDLLAVLPMHPNPTVRAAWDGVLSGHDRVVLCEPLGYAPFSHLLASSTVVLTDSGGLQEEAPRLGVPVLVLRQTTERPEGVEAGAARLVGVASESIEDGVRAVLHDAGVRRSMSHCRDLYGDGRAAERAVLAVAHRCGLGERPADFVATVARRRVVEHAR